MSLTPTYLAIWAMLQQEDGAVVAVSDAGAQGGAGATWWIEQTAMATLSSGDFDAIWTTEESGTMPVSTYTGDVDGDGRADLGLTAMVEDRASVGSGVALEWQASFFPDPSMDGTMDALTDAEYQIFRAEDEGAFIGVEDLGWFGNAGPAVLLRAPDSPPDSRSGDCVVLQSDELAEEALAADLQLSLTGSAAGDDACRSSVAADLNQDSDLDLLIGAPGVDGARENAGRVYGLLAP